MKTVMGVLLGLATLVPAVAFAADLTPEQILAKAGSAEFGIFKLCGFCA